MSISTNGQLCFGILFEEGYEFPWDADEFDGGIEEWWQYKIWGYKDPVEIWTKDGEYINGKKPPKDVMDLYYDTQKKFREKHPVPVNLINCCSCDYPRYIIAILSTCKSASRGYPEILSPKELVVDEYDARNLINFCKKYCTPKDEFCEIPEFKPKWYLSSYWG